MTLASRNAGLGCSASTQDVPSASLTVRTSLFYATESRLMTAASCRNCADSWKPNRAKRLPPVASLMASSDFATKRGDLAGAHSQSCHRNRSTVCDRCRHISAATAPIGKSRNRTLTHVSPAEWNPRFTVMKMPTPVVRSAAAREARSPVGSRAVGSLQGAGIGAYAALAARE
jgi:hypothetical protein